MQNWDTMQTTANYVEHNNWYNNMFAANIKTEPGTSSPISQNQQNSQAQSNAPCTTHLENFLKQHQQQYSAMDTNMTTLTPSPSSSGNNANGDQQQQQFFDATSMHHQQMMQKQQQQYQQYFQHAQQVASQNQVTTHLPLGFKPLTPPGLPQAILPAMPHFYPQSNQTQRNQQQTPSPQLLDAAEKSDLTPRHTPPMDITPPKSPKVPNLTPTEKQQDQELMSNCSEDLKCTADSEDDENIRTPIYNSHGKIKNYRCKSCGSNAITKLAFWEHAKTHMKPEKILQCPKCPFVTELKHHLEYHIRKHKNIKPFQCDKCTYTCVSKSMLISHRKSHSSVYPYRCDGCDYVTKYCHSFKLHLRKYDHKPGVVLDEDGIPNPSVVIDVYGTRRGPKSKGSVSGSNTKKANNDLKMSAHHSQLSAALQGFAINNNQQNQISDTSANVNPTVASELPALTLNMSLQQQQQQQQQSNTNQNSNNQQQSQNSSQNDNITNLLPPLATILPYINYNFNIQMLAQQQLALAQLSPRLREQLQKHQQQLELNQAQNQAAQDGEDLESDNKEDEDDDQEFDSKSVDSAMDLSQGTPTKEDGQQQQTPAYATNLKLPEDNIETPLFSSTTSTRRKGRVLKLDQEHKKQSTTNTQQNSAPTSPQKDEMPTTSSPIATSPASTKVDEQSSADESMETNTAQNNPSNTSSASAASSSGNSSNSSSTVASNSNNSPENSSPSVTPTMYECQYCPIIFKDPVMYTIHKGYHSCDDVFKCNMCGEKCDGYLSLFVHMARNAHS